jgi:hypothetical protein
VNPATGSRKWIKLWVEPWLDGTTRYQMTDAQRAFWVDLLAMAGRGRIAGVVCAGKDGDTLIGYPLAKFEGLLSEKIDVLATFDLFAKTGKIRVEVSDTTPTLYVVHILNWEKYQSPYEAQNTRQRRRRAKKQADVTPDVTPVSRERHAPCHTSVTPCHAREVEVRSKKEKLEGEERPALTCGHPSLSQEADRERLWSGLAGVSECLVAPEKFLRQRNRIEEVAARYGVDAVVSGAQQFFDLRVHTDTDRDYAALQFSETAEQFAYVCRNRESTIPFTNVSLEVLNKLAELSQGVLAFSDEQKPRVLQVTHKYGNDVVVEAAEEYLEDLPEESQPWAARDFAETAEQRAYTVAQRKRNDAVPLTAEAA